MTTNNDDIKDEFQDDLSSDFEDFEDDAPFVDFDSGNGNGTLGELIRNNPLVKVGIILGGFVIIIGGLVLFGGKDQVATPSVIQAGNIDATETRGVEEVPPSYRDAVRESDTEALEQAVQTQGSAMPTLLNTPRETLPLPATEEPVEDPLERWRRLQEERQRRDTPPPVAQQPQGNPHADTIRSLAEAMARQMESILTNTQPRPSQIKRITTVDYLDRQNAQAAENAALVGQGQQQPPQTVNILVPAGTVEYGQLLIEANSDTPGPVLVQIVSGPLAGSRMLGQFTTQSDYLVLSMNMLVVDGISYSAQAIALDPDTTRPGVMTDINRRYFQRFILPAAAAFVEGLGEAIAESGSTTVTVNNGTVVQDSSDLDTRQEAFSAVEKAAEKIGDALDAHASRTRPMIKVAAGTPIGILFLQPVAEKTQ